jgi:predicted aspartyl protease
MGLLHPDRRAVTLGLAAGALAAPSLTRAQMHEPPKVTLIDPEAASKPVPDAVLAASADPAHRMTVPVTIDGRGPFPFIVDTGSTVTVLSEVLAAQLGLRATDKLLVKAATGVATSDAVRVMSLEVGPRRLANLHMPILARTDLGALGILGIDAVSREKLVMDFRKKQMTLTASTRRGEDPFGVTVTAKSRYGQLLLVDCDVEGMPLYVILDTGSEVSIGNFTMRAMLERHRAAYEVEVAGVTGVSVFAPIGLLRQLDMGHVQVTNLNIAYADLYTFEQFGLHDKPAMLLGMSTLRHFDRVSIDFPAREVRFSLDS